MNYTELSLDEIRRALGDIGLDVEKRFGVLDDRELNWKPEPAKWSVAQCLEHLHNTNEMMRASANDALHASSRSMWQRIPGLPSLLGRALINSQAPTSTRRYTAPPSARPTASEIGADIVLRFVQQNQALIEWTTTFDDSRAGEAIMGSPFLRAIVYSVLDALRLIVAHDHRHIQQATRVLEALRSQSRGIR